MISNPRILRGEPFTAEYSLVADLRNDAPDLPHAFATVLLVMVAGLGQSVHAIGGGQPKFQRISTQYIAALGDPDATSGSGAESGLWPLDPGPGSAVKPLEELEEAGASPRHAGKFDHRLVAGGTRPHHGAADISDPLPANIWSRVTARSDHTDHSSRRQEW